MNKIFLKSILLPFTLTAVAAFIVNENITAIPDLIKNTLHNFSEKKATAKGFPIWTFILMFIAAISEILLILGIKFGLIKLAFNKALGKVLSIGFALLGTIAGLTFSLWHHDDKTQASQGLALLLATSILIVASVLVPLSVRYLNSPGHTPNNQKIMKIVTFIICCIICAISLNGIFQYITL